MAKLTTKERNALPSSDFAEPKAVAKKAASKGSPRKRA